MLYQSNVDWVEDLYTDVFGWIFAGSIFAGVRISFLSVKATVGFDVFKGLGRKATVAAKVVESSSTIHKLLLGERNAFSKCLMICCLKSSCRAAERNQTYDTTIVANIILFYLKVQQDPHLPWSLTGLTIPSSLQSFCIYTIKRLRAKLKKKVK